MWTQNSPRVENEVSLHHTLEGIGPCNAHGGGTQLWKEVGLQEASEALRPGIMEAVSAASILQKTGGAVGHPRQVEARTGHTQLGLERGTPT